jgi:hypothetical protein
MHQRQINCELYIGFHLHYSNKNLRMLFYAK